MAYGGLLGGLPPGLRGYVAAEQNANQRGVNQLGQLQGILGIQGLMQQRQQQEQQQQAMQALMPQFTDPAARMLAQAGNIPAAISRQFPQQQYKTVGGSLVDVTPGRQPTAAFTEAPRPQLVDVPVPGQPGVTQKQWMTPGQSQGQSVGGPAMPRILNPDVFRAEAALAQAKRPVTNVNVPVNLAGNKYAETVGGKAGERDITQHESAINAVDNLDKLNTVVKHLESSDAITGLGAEALKNVERVKAFVTDSEKAGKRVSDTELLDAFLGSDVFPMIKALGIGARGLDTPAEREFLRQVMTGTISMNKKTLVKMTKIRRDIAARAVERWNERVEGGELDRYFEFTQTPKKKLPVLRRSTDQPSAGQVPPGIDPRAWGVMTPDERALWQK